MFEGRESLKKIPGFYNTQRLRCHAIPALFGPQGNPRRSLARRSWQVGAGGRRRFIARGI